MPSDQTPVACPHEREIMQYTGDGDEVAFCPDCGHNRFTGCTRPPASEPPRPAPDDGIAGKLLACPDIEHARIVAIDKRVPEVIVPSALRDQAAATITAMQSEIEALRRALEDIAHVAEPDDHLVRDAAHAALTRIGSTRNG